MYLYDSIVRLFKQERSVGGFAETDGFQTASKVFHTVMVSECAKVVTSYMIELKPELLLGILDCQSVSDVMERRADLLDYVKDVFAS